MQVQSNNLKLFLKSQGVFFSLSVLLRNHCWFCILYHTGRQKHFLLTFLKRKMNSASIVLKYKYYFSLSGEEISSPFWFFGELQLVFLSFFFFKKKKKVSLNTSYLLPRTLAVNLLVTPGCLHSTQFFMPSSLFIILIKSVSLLSQEIQGLTLSKGRRQFAVVEGA